MGVPSPCVSQRLGDPAFAHMKRVVCLGARLFLIGFITRHTSKRVLDCRNTSPFAVFRCRHVRHGLTDVDYHHVGTWV
jgi:hypothetical protein